MIATEIEPEIQRLVAARDFTVLRNIFKEWSPVHKQPRLSSAPWQSGK